MVSVIFKSILVLYLFAHLANGSPNADNVTSSTTKTTPTASEDHSGEATYRFETAVHLDPGDGQSRSKHPSYSNRGNDYAQQAYVGNEYEERDLEYENDPNPHEVFYKRNEEDSYSQHDLKQQPHPGGYVTSYQQQYDQGYHPVSQDPNYEEQDEQRSSYPAFPGHPGNTPPYGQQDYSKVQSHDSKEGDAYEGGRPPYLQYAYEVSHKQKQPTYEPVDAPENDGKAGYGSAQTKAYPPKDNHLEYYPRPVPTRYIPDDRYKQEEYQSITQKDRRYMPAVPKEAGYMPSGQKEPGYLQVHQKETSYPQQAGYMPSDGKGSGYMKVHQKETSYPQQAGYMPSDGKGSGYMKVHQKESPYSQQAGYMPSNQKGSGYMKVHQKGTSYPQHAGYLQKHQEEEKGVVQILPQEGQARLADAGKLAIYIRHLGHNSGDHLLNKGRQGYLLLPLVPGKMEEKVTQVRGRNLGDEYRHAYQEDKEDSHPQRLLQEKEIYSDQKVPVVGYPVEAKVAIPYDPDYVQDRKAGKVQAKSVVSQTSYGQFRPITDHSTYSTSAYESPKTSHAYSYTGDEAPESRTPYIPKVAVNYKGEKELKTYSRAAYAPMYAGNHGVVPRYVDAIKYERASVYAKEPEYVSQYDVTSSQKAAPVKSKEFRQPPFYSTAPYLVSYARIADYAPLLRNSKKRNVATKHLYNAHYKNVGARLAARYYRPRLEVLLNKPKSVAIVKQKPVNPEPVIIRSPYSSGGHIAAKKLAGDASLHESVVGKINRRDPSVGSLYYDLHRYPSGHKYASLRYRKSGAKY